MSKKRGIWTKSSLVSVDEWRCSLNGGYYLTTLDKRNYSLFSAVGEYYDRDIAQFNADTIAEAKWTAEDMILSELWDVHEEILKKRTKWSHRKI